MLADAPEGLDTQTINLSELELEVLESHRSLVAETTRNIFDGDELDESFDPPASCPSAPAPSPDCTPSPERSDEDLEESFLE